MIRQILLILILDLTVTLCHAQVPYPFDGVHTSPISGHYLYLCDTGNNLTPQHALEKFAAGKGLTWSKGRTFNVGIKPWIYWFKFSAVNISPQNQVTVFRISTSLSSYRIFREDSTGGLVTLFQGSTATAFDQRPFRHRDIAIPLQLSPGEQITLLFSVDKRGRGLYMPLYFNSLENTLRMELRRHWVYAWHFGIYLFIALFNIFLFAIFRDKIHLWYIGYILSALLFMFEDEKFYVEYFPGSWIQFCETAGTFPYSLLLLGCGMRVMQLLLQQERKNSYGYLPVTIVTWCAFILAAILFIHAGFNTPAANGLLPLLHTAVDIVVGLSLLLILASTIEKIIRRQVLAVYYLMATLTPFIGALIFYLNHFGITNINPIQPNGIVAGITIEVILLSFLLVVRYNNLRKDKLRLIQQINEQERALIIKVLDSAEDERKRIASDLHDDLGGTLNALKLHITRQNEKLSLWNDEEKEYYLQLLKLASRASEDLRSVAHNLLPRDFSKIGLVKTLENSISLLGKSTPIHFTFISEGDIAGIDEQVAIIIYRIINEITNNIVKHSEASESTIQLLRFNGHLQVFAEDNGIGLNKTSNTGGMGLNNIHSRVAFLKGSIYIDSNEKGTSIIINIPLNADSHA